VLIPLEGCSAHVLVQELLVESCLIACVYYLLRECHSLTECMLPLEVCYRSVLVQGASRGELPHSMLWYTLRDATS